MADTPALLPQLPAVLSSATAPLTEKDAVFYPVLVPNMRGLDNLLSLEKQHQSSGRRSRLTNEIAIFVAASEAFSQANTNASIEKVLSALPAVIAKAKEHGYRVRGYVSCVMACPYAGKIPPSSVVPVVKRLVDMGVYEVSLGDTTGEGNPEDWRLLWDALERAGLPTQAMAAHCHDTFATALASILSLLPRGLHSIDSSLAGLGGCPYSPGATGNVPTEDVVYALHQQGYTTGIDLNKLVEAGQWLCETLGVRNESRVGRAMWARRKVREEKEAKAAAAV
jgi:hydroxymethylglutaryl-CoA lyase